MLNISNPLNYIMFHKYILDFDPNLFTELLVATQFEDICKGRQGAILIDNNNGLVPIVRTTTNYLQASQKFSPIHYKIIDLIKGLAKDLKLEFNNAMVELYDSSYRTMKYHTDLSLDLADDSYICIFSSYSNNDLTDYRKLKIKDKVTNIESEVILENNSCVIFSKSDNSKHLHKIVLDKINNKDKKWLGITFRLSKTFINFVDDKPYFYPTDIPLRVGSDDEKREFMKCKGSENLGIDYVYPTIHYTVSISDTLPIIK